MSCCIIKFNPQESGGAVGPYESILWKLPVDCRLAWLIDRYGNKVYVYEPERAIVEYSSLDIQLSGEPLFQGFRLNLAKIVR